ncbi:hypothetical protein OS493_016923 [Desmophyllum pertusum]|uniref:Copper transport protein n=1 Tax=Desmophyllum pertusum TaxID=174260 RepID=A0A9X0CK16_9CNID|nr:hypothetical protein OS493_016923 [Desmophyllum pertusum]
MTLSFVEELQVLIRQWKVTSIYGLSGSLIAVFSLAVLYEFMSSYHSYLDLPAGKKYVTREPSRRKRIQDHLLRTVSYLLSTIAGYLLMLVISTWHVWLIVSIVTGSGFGYFLSNPLYTWYRSKESGDDQRNNNDYRNRTKRTLGQRERKSPS